MKLPSTLRPPPNPFSDVAGAFRKPILLAGLPRSGSSWTGKILATGGGLRYYREPFNAKWQRFAEPFQFRYLRATDENGEFDRYCRAVFKGRIGGPSVERHQWGRYVHFTWWPGRLLVKEVHAVLALERIEHLVRPRTVVLVRHPCALASSWMRLLEARPDDPMWKGVDDHLRWLLDQEALVDEYLAPYVSTIESAQTYLEKVGALWGAVYTVMLKQAERHSDWVVVTHESLSADPERAFRRLFNQLGVRWTYKTSRVLEETTSKHSTSPYETVRVSENEPEKWRTELSEEQVREVLAGAAPFSIGLYDDLQESVKAIVK